MYLRNIRFLVFLNALLALLILALLVCLLLGQWRQRSAQSPTGTNASGKVFSPFGKPPASRREIDAGHVGVRPVSFSRVVVSAEVAEGWRVRGMQPQEWARLPASPGMDMTEMPEGYLLTFSLPGVLNEDIRLSVTDRVVTVQAVVRDPLGNQVGGLERRVLLPQTPGDPADFKAVFTNGLLRVCVAK